MSNSAYARTAPIPLSGMHLSSLESAHLTTICVLFRTLHRIRVGLQYKIDESLISYEFINGIPNNIKIFFLTKAKCQTGKLSTMHGKLPLSEMSCGSTNSTGRLTKLDLKALALLVSNTCQLISLSISTKTYQHTQMHFPMWDMCGSTSQLYYARSPGRMYMESLRPFNISGRNHSFTWPSLETCRSTYVSLQLTKCSFRFYGS